MTKVAYAVGGLVLGFCTIMAAAYVGEQLGNNANTTAARKLAPSPEVL
jgi:hypothetical protein